MGFATIFPTNRSHPIESIITHGQVAGHTIALEQKCDMAADTSKAIEADGLQWLRVVEVHSSG